KFLADRKDAKVHSVADVADFNLRNAARELSIFGQEWFEKAIPKKLTDKDYIAARARCIKITREQLIDKVMAEHKLDAFIPPPGGPAWLTDLVNGDSGTGVSPSPLPAVSGYAHVTVPAGQFRGLPVGLSFFAGPYSEPKLIGYAYAYEQGTK